MAMNSADYLMDVPEQRGRAAGVAARYYLTAIPPPVPYDHSSSFLRAADSISLIRFSWLTSLAPGS